LTLHTCKGCTIQYNPLKFPQGRSFLEGLIERLFGLSTVCSMTRREMISAMQFYIQIDLGETVPLSSRYEVLAEDQLVVLL